jgi:VanZ family protein
MLKKNIYSIIVALVILFLSFTGAETFEKLPVPNIPHLDKLVHLGMYFTLMLALIVENQALLINLKKYLILSIIPVFFGAVIEILQSLLTRTRTGDFFDACFNAIGVMMAIIIWLLFKKLRKSEVK